MNVYILFDPDGQPSVYASLEMAREQLPAEFGWVYYPRVEQWVRADDDGWVYCPQVEQWVCADDDGWSIQRFEVYDDGREESGE